jgi:hypothetical protein
MLAVPCNCGVRIANYITLHYITLHYITLHYITLQKRGRHALTPKVGGLCRAFNDTTKGKGCILVSE